MEQSLFDHKTTQDSKEKRINELELINQKITCELAQLQNKFSELLSIIKTKEKENSDLLVQLKEIKGIQNSYMERIEMELKTKENGANKLDSENKKLLKKVENLDELNNNIKANFEKEKKELLLKLSEINEENKRLKFLTNEKITQVSNVF